MWRTALKIQGTSNSDTAVVKYSTEAVATILLHRHSSVSTSGREEKLQAMQWIALKKMPAEDAKIIGAILMKRGSLNKKYHLLIPRYTCSLVHVRGARRLAAQLP